MISIFDIIKIIALVAYLKKSSFQNKSERSLVLKATSHCLAIYRSINSVLCILISLLMTGQLASQEFNGDCFFSVLKSTVSFLGVMNTSIPGDSLKVPFNTLPNAPRPISFPNTTCSGRTSQFLRAKMVDFDLKCKQALVILEYVFRAQLPWNLVVKLSVSKQTLCHIYLDKFTTAKYFSFDSFISPIRIRAPR